MEDMANRTRVEGGGYSMILLHDVTNRRVVITFQTYYYIIVLHR